MYDKNKVSISIGGGLGDAIQVYMANPKSHCEDGENNYPTTNHMASVWFRRLDDFKKNNPDVEIIIINSSHNLSTISLFETNPNISFIHNYYGKSEYRLWGTEGLNYSGIESSCDIEMEYNPIYWIYDYFQFALSEEINFYLTEDDINLLNSHIHPYIIMHPEAMKPRDIVPEIKYTELNYILNDRGYNSYIIKKDSGYNARVSVMLTLNCDGFVGTHSAMWNTAVWAGWKYGIHTACLIPKIPHFDRIKGSAVAWGLEQPFNKTWSFYNYYEASKFDMQEVVDWLLIK